MSKKTPSSIAPAGAQTHEQQGENPDTRATSQPEATSQPDATLPASANTGTSTAKDVASDAVGLMPSDGAGATPARDATTATKAAATGPAGGLSNFQSIVRRAPSLAQMSPTVSRLVNDQEDVMELHTREAMMLFLGRDSGEERRFGVPGARHAAGALRQLFVLTARDNPYADMVLVEVDRRAKLIREKISEHRARQFNKLEALKRMGLSYSVVRAQVPQSVNLGYYSPYGYTMSTLIVLYDECVRVLKSAERRDLISRAELHDALFDMKHAIRSLFDVVLKAQRTLCNENMRPLVCFRPDQRGRV